MPEEFSFVPSDPVVDPAGLARAVRQRRAELRLSQDDVRRSSGLSITTISKIERGDPDLTVQRATLNRLDLALDWTVGTAASWLEGHGGVVPTAPAAGPDVVRWAEELAPLVVEHLRASRVDVSLDGLPPRVVDALEHLIRELRHALAYRTRDDR